MEKSIANQEVSTVDASKVIGRSAECLRRLMEAGLSYKNLQLPIDDPKMRDRLVRFWKSGGQEVKQAVDSVARIFVDYTKPLQRLIDDNHFNYVNSGITEEYFPIIKRLNNKVKIRVFSTQDLVGETKCVTSKEALKALTEKGYRPAELPEGLAYAKANPNEQKKYPIVVLGSIGQGWSGWWPSYRAVPYFHSWNDERHLFMNGVKLDWISRSRFLAVRK